MIHFDSQGLIPVVIQDEHNGQILMVASMNEEALSLTRSTGFTHFYSRSRNKLWRKGEQSGNVQEVYGIYVNCEENSLLLKVVQHGPGACHTGYRSCYYRQLQDDDTYEIVGERLFDPEQVYGGEQVQPAVPTPVVSTVVPLSEQECQQLANDMRALYSAYIYLRDNDLSGESNTSRLLQDKSIEYLVARLGDELQELIEVQEGIHQHTGRHEDTVLEGSQVAYWLMLAAATLNVKYTEVEPHEAILRGYSVIGHQTLEQAEECLPLLLSDDRSEVITGLAMGFSAIGQACAEAGVSPLEPAEYDMAQMRRKGFVTS